MKLLVFGKYPPIEGGTSGQTLNTVRLLAAAGHEVDVVTNAREAEVGVRALMTPSDEDRLSTLEAAGAQGPHGARPPRIRVHHTSPLSRTAYMPWAEPFVSKLFGIGVELARSNSFDLVLGWYLEPYGMAAGMVAEAAGLPLVLRHAGSDINRLARQTDLQSAYRWLLGRADRVLTGPRSARLLGELGANPASLRMSGFGTLPDYFDEPAAPIQLAELAGPAAAVLGAIGLSVETSEALLANLTSLALPLPAPVVGVCGKVASAKGSYDLVAALERLAEDGVAFTLLGALGGQEELFSPFLEALVETRHVRSRAVILPFLAPWRMPGLFDACDVVCVLERRFDVPVHRTRVPEEVLRRGRPLLLSGEIAESLPFSAKLEDRLNCLRVEDPSDIDGLASVLRETLTDRGLREQVARGARALSDELSANASGDGPTAAVALAISELCGRSAPPVS
ncbi:MAG: glycosyltransferase [Acidimicrobiales bacterium]